MKYTCEKCGKTLDEMSFYTYADGRKTEMCKKCMTMHIDNFDPDTYIWLLEKMDVPYIPEEWDSLRDKAYARNPAKMNGMSVFGKYLSKMKLKQFKGATFADSEKYQREAAVRKEKLKEKKEKIEEDATKRFENGEISEAQYRTLVSTEAQEEAVKSGLLPNPTLPPDSANNPYQENFFISEDELPNPATELTEEDKLYLAMKWGRLYKPNEWIELEKHYNEMMAGFDIQDPDTKNTLVLLCKTDLKMNQAIDCGDVDGFQKLSRVSESLRKSAKFTAAQNKEAKGDFIDSIGEFVAMCEKEEGFIPRYATDIPQDKVDATLKDMNNYLYKLVTQDLGFGQQIEDSLKKIQIQKQMNETEEKAIKENNGVVEIDDKDHEEFLNSIEEQKEKDYKLLYGKEGN